MTVESQPGGTIEPPQPAAAPRTGTWIRRHRIATAALGLAVVLIALGGWAGWQLWREVSALSTIKTSASQLQQDAAAHDPDAVRSGLADVRAQATAAVQASQDPILQAGEHLPLIGGDIAAVRQVSSVVAGLGATTTQLDALLPKLIGSKHLDLSGSTELLAFAKDVATVADTSATQLQQIDTAQLHSPPQARVVELRSGLQKVSPTLTKLSPFLRSLAILAAPHAEQRWLVVMQNLGEARASGGLVSNWLILETHDGTLKVLEQGTNDKLVDAKNPTYRSVMPKGYQEIWGNHLGKWLSMNLSANFPDNARLMADAWNSRHSEKVDGVLTMGQGTVTYLAAAAGKVSVVKRTLAPSELTDYLTYGVYQDYPDPKAKDAAVTEIISQVFDRLTSGEYGPHLTPEDRHHDHQRRLPATVVL